MSAGDSAACRAEYFIWLSELCGAGSPLPKKVYELFDGDLCAAYDTQHDEYLSLGLNEEEAELLSDKDFTRANMIIDYCAENRVGLLIFGSEYYPPRLYGIETPPPVLYFKGRIERLGHGPFITAVGSRKCSESAYDAGYSVSYKLACAGVSLVSGIAGGIDTACTVGALDAGGFAVGVLGSGINILYPFDNSALFSRMFRSGLIITEFSPFTEPKGVNFPIRNRVMAALGDAVLVVEARSGSGALITADYAHDMGKKIYAVPGSISNPLCSGSNALLKNGATAVTDAEDIISDLEFSYPAAVSTASRRTRRERRERLPEKDSYISRRKRRAARAERQNKAEGAFDETSAASPKPEKEPAPDISSLALSETEKAVYLALREEKASSDILGRKLSIGQEEVLGALTMLEIYGLAESLPGGIYGVIE